MATLSAVPGNHDLIAYGGDTYILRVNAPAEVTDGMEWHAEIRATKDSPTVDAEFVVTPPTVAGGPAYLTLTAVDSARLAGFGVVVTKRMADGSQRAVQRYSGVWDCQINPPVDPDPVRTLIQGTITVELDVTRPV